MTAFDWAFLAFLYLGWGNTIVCHRIRVTHTMPDMTLAGFVVLLWLPLMFYFYIGRLTGEWRAA